MLVNNKFHLSYCTNIHPGSNWESTFTSLKENVPRIKAKVSTDTRFGLGLRLSNKASEELNTGDNFAIFKTWLSQHDLYVFTMNGFPYGNFHDERVKDDVHTPDWTTQKRLKYTQRLFVQLSELLPDGMSGGISTSPISYKYWHKSEAEKQKAFEDGAKHLSEIILQLIAIEENTGKYLHLDIEPEPDGLIENSDEIVAFFDSYLIPVATKVLKKKLNIEDGAEEIIKKYITVCYDICHFSLAYEEPEDTFKKFADADILIGKIQVSAALKILYNAADADEIWSTLARFDEPTYLHQVTEKVGDTVKTYNDLPVVLKDKKEFTELRAHFHVPIFLEKFGKLFSTQDHILKVVEYLKQDPVSDHLEIETYTWDVLPTEMKKEIAESIIREIEWLKERL